MRIPQALKKGDIVAVVSLSSGTLGEDFCAHQRKLAKERAESFGLQLIYMPHALEGIQALKEHPQWRAEDLKAAFADPSIAGIICAIGGEDTFKLLPYLMEDRDFIRGVREHPKVFTGFSDTTINHLMLYKLGLRTFYGPNILCDLAELDQEMLPYTREAFSLYFQRTTPKPIISSPIWYEERKDFSAGAMGTSRIPHTEKWGYQLLQGLPIFSGRLWGGCLESLYEALKGQRYADEPALVQQYDLLSGWNEGKEAILFLETSEEAPSPEKFEQ